MEEDDAPGPVYRLTRDRIIYATVDNPNPLGVRPDRHDTPAWVSNPSFAMWTAFATPYRPRSSKRARVDATSEDAILGLLPTAHTPEEEEEEDDEVEEEQDEVEEEEEEEEEAAPELEEEDVEVAPELEEEDVEWVDGAIECS